MSAINAATALTIQRFMCSHLRPGSDPQINASTKRNGLPWRDGNNYRNSGVEWKSPGLSGASVLNRGFRFFCFCKDCEPLSVACDQNGR